MKNAFFSFFIILCCSTTIVHGQDMHFTQFYSSSLYLNPAFAGAEVCGRVSTSYRNQWPGVSKAYRSYLLAGDHYIPDYKLGVGVLFGTDAAGTGDLKTTTISPLVAYEAKMTRELIVRFGVQPGIGIHSISFNKLLFGDQIARGGNVATIEDQTQSKTYFDIGAGMLAYTKNYWIGTSFYHLNKPNESLIPGHESVLPVRYSVHGGYTYALNEDEKEEFKRKSIAAAFHYRGQGNFDQFDIGAYYMQYVFNLGIWYRGLPFLKSYQP
ncbi:MAG TPA: PorP/SprF family type IX secretion system membrane protein, partial [Bacteroidia bacterium]|nr:PorP/SprF family type IX secretion system membrane protein [Bacteroidia bacterium]